ncbi:MAG: TonB-dependent receptor [Bryobacteraceae bacterium]
MLRTSLAGRVSARARQSFAVISLCALVTLLGLNPNTSFAQQVGATLFGTVTDPAGAVIPDASVTALNPANGRTTTTTTHPDGAYVFPYLEPADYTITVQKTGFGKSEQTGITLVVNQKSRLDIQLQVGTVTTTVETTATAPMVETGTASVGMTVDTRQVTELPLNTRRFGSLPLLMAGTVPDRGGFSSNIFGSPFSEVTYASNGLRGSGNNVLIDGVDAKNMFTGGFSIQPSPDAVQEFKVQTQSFSAVFGKNGGSTINLTTKQGTNQFHGSAFEFLRNNNMDARNFFSASRPSYQRNQFGGYVGGPIRKNKTFFFGGYEALRERKGLTYSGQVPTPAMLNGDFSALLSQPDPNTGASSYRIIDPLSCSNPPFGATCQPFAGNIIPANRINSVAKVVIPYFPAPDISGATTVGSNNYVINPKRRRDDNQVSGRVDHTFSEKDNLYARYMLAQSITYTPEQAYSALPGFGDRIRFRGQNVAASWTHIVNPTILNEVRVGFSRNMDIGTCESCPRKPGFVSSFGIQNLSALSPADEGFPAFQFGQGYFTIGDSNYRPVESNDMVEKYEDTLTITKGKHTIAIGTDIQPYQSLRNQAPFSPHGQFGFNNNYSNFTISDFLLGYPSSAGRSIAKAVNNHDGKFINFFAQDDFRVSQKLTLNIGLRYEHHQLPTDRRDIGASLVQLPGTSLFTPGNAVLVMAGYDQASKYCNLPQFIVNAGTPSQYNLIACPDQMKKLGFTGRAARSLWLGDNFNWAPRFGFAYRPTNSDRLVVRGGYGLFFELAEFNEFHYGFNNPVQAPDQFSSFEASSTPTPLQSAFIGGSTPPLSQAFISINPDSRLRQPYVHEWSFSIESQLSASTALEVRYVGTSAIELGHFHFFGNQAVPGAGDIQSRRLYPDFGFTAQMSSGANANYNGLQVQLTRRMARGIQFLAGYTFAKNISNNEGEEGGYSDGGAPLGQNDNNPAMERGLTVNDVRHRVTFSSLFELPFGKGKHWLSQSNRLVDGILGGWELTALASFQTGFPITPQSGIDSANVGTGNWRPDRVCNGNLPSDQRTIARWFDTSCFTNQFLIADNANGIFRFGNSGRSVLTGPGIQNFDFALLKNFALTESKRIQFRAEAFNALNHANFGADGVITHVNDSRFGQVTSASEGRDVQIALKFLF